MFGRLRLPALAAALMLCIGCAQRCRHHHQATERISAEFDLPTVERSKIVGEVALASHTEEAPSAAPSEYLGLTAAEAQCLAAENSAIGKLLDRERWSSCLQTQHGKDRRSRCLQLSVLRAASQEARNKSAADALKLYYGIAEVEAGLDAVDVSLTKINEGTAKIAQLKRQGLSVPFDATEFERRRMTLESKRADLQATRLKLNTQLRTLLGFEQQPGAALILPTEPLKATDEPLDAEGAVAYGQMTRGELQVLCILCSADPDTAAETIRSLLGGMHGLAGLAAKASACKLLLALGGGQNCDSSTRRSQVCELYRSRREQLAGEIRAAVEKITARRRQAVLAQEQLASWGRRIHELSQRRETGGSSFIELLQAELFEAEARAAVTTAVIELKRAEVELRELQGALAAECCGVNMTSTMTVHAAPPSLPSVEPIPAETVPQPKRGQEFELQSDAPTIPQLLLQPPRPERESLRVNPASWQRVKSSPHAKTEAAKSPSAAMFGPPPVSTSMNFGQ